MSTQSNTTKTAAPSTNRTIFLATVFAAGVAIIANTIITLAGLAAGAAVQTPGHMPITGLYPAFYVALSILGVLAGTVGWTLIGKYAKRPSRVLRVLVPVVWLLTLVPLISTGAQSGTPAVWTSMVTLILVHTVTVIIAVLVFVRMLPVTGRSR
jgi:hypothetical protein